MSGRAAGDPLKRGQDVTFRDTPPKNFSFAECLEAQRIGRGLTQVQAAGMVPVSCRTWKRWERGRAVPSAAVRAAVLELLAGPGGEPGRRKRAALARSHHLYWERHKGWILRLTIDRGPKLVGKRVKFPLGTRELEDAVTRRSVVLRALRRLGLKVRVRRQGKRRARGPGPEGKIEKEP